MEVSKAGRRNAALATDSVTVSGERAQHRAAIPAPPQRNTLAIFEASKVSLGEVGAALMRCSPPASSSAAT